MAAKSNKRLGIPSRTGVPRSSPLFKYTAEAQRERAFAHYKNVVYAYARRTNPDVWRGVGRLKKADRQAVYRREYNRARQDPEFKLLYEGLRYYEKRNERGIEQDRRPDGPWARILEHLGMREVGARWPPGDTETFGSTIVRGA